MSAARVDAVISTAERHDAPPANWMRVAAGELTAGEGEELITQAGLQRCLWYDLTERHADDFADEHSPHASASRSAPSTCTARERTGRWAGPRTTAPEVTSNWLP